MTPVNKEYDNNLYTRLYVYIAYRKAMSGKLYWRIKKDGRWTWTPAQTEWNEVYKWIIVIPLEGEEE